MKKLTYITSILFAIFAFLASGCLMEHRYYIGYYDVHTPRAKKQSFRPEFKSIAESIANHYHLPVVESKYDPYNSAFIDTRTINTNGVRIFLSWNISRAEFGISLTKYDSEETPEVVETRKFIETLLNAHPDYTWKFDLSHYTIAR